MTDYEIVGTAMTIVAILGLSCMSKCNEILMYMTLEIREFNLNELNKYLSIVFTEKHCLETLYVTLELYY